MPAFSYLTARPMASAASHNRSPQRRIEIRRRGDLDDLLMPPLHRAIALEEMHQVAVLVAQQLHFDVPRPADELLDEDIGLPNAAATRAAPAPGSAPVRRLA